jgi:predicted RNase H-like HicB family nuclease
MKTKVLNYNVLIRKENYENKENVYVASVPTLGISDYAPTIDKVLKNIEKLIKFHVDCLIKEGELVPPSDDADNSFMVNSKVEVKTDQNIVFS